MDHRDLALRFRVAQGVVRGAGQMAADRFRPGGRATPLPNPGVYARHNAVDTMARLPDGSDDESSVSVIIRRRPVTTNGHDGNDQS